MLVLILYLTSFSTCENLFYFLKSGPVKKLIKLTWMYIISVTVLLGYFHNTLYICTCAS